MGVKGREWEGARMIYDPQRHKPSASLLLRTVSQLNCCYFLFTRQTTKTRNLLLFFEFTSIKLDTLHLQTIKPLYYHQQSYFKYVQYGGKDSTVLHREKIVRYP